ncbi:MAG: TVP38/TMEM64 family protein [Cyanobacteria bacterium J06635_15]
MRRTSCSFPAVYNKPLSSTKHSRSPIGRRRRFILTRSNAIALALIIACVAVIGGLHRYDMNLLTKAGLQEVIAQLGAWGPLLYIAVLALSVVVSQIPGLPMACAAGAVWGTWVGGLYTVMGGFLGAMVAYYLGHTLGRSSIRALSGKTISFTTRRGHLFLGWLVFITRLLPVVSFDLVSYSAGMARLSLPIYMGATLLGMTPSTLLITYLGESFTLSMPITVAFWIVFLGVLVGLPWGIRRYNWFGLRDVIRID